jgi:hypothetical protein
MTSQVLEGACFRLEELHAPPHGISENDSRRSAFLFMTPATTISISCKSLRSLT